MVDLGLTISIIPLSKWNWWCLNTPIKKGTKNQNAPIYYLRGIHINKIIRIQ